MTLGTVQLGLTYGAANQTGQPSESQAISLICQAVEGGITHLDCAQAYGDAERVVGQAMDSLANQDVAVITKLSPLDQLGSDTLITQVIQVVDESIIQSCERLKRPVLDVLMLHRWQHYTAYEGQIWERLRWHQEQSRIIRLGVSVQSPEEALEALKEPLVSCLQLPFNLLDHRWKSAGVHHVLLEKRPDVMVYARSALLQGILAADASCWPKGSEIRSDDWVQRLTQLRTELNRESRVDLCLAYVRSQHWIHSIVVGVETPTQLAENLALFQRSALTPMEVELVETRLTGAPEALLNPTLWRLSE